jgi:hypothetical protein
MGNYKEDINQGFGTIFFIIIFSLFALSFSGNSESRTSSLPNYSLQYELAMGNIPVHFNATIVSPVNLPDLYKNLMNTTHNINLNTFSLEHKISGFNSKTDQDFISIQKIRLSIEPLFPWGIYYLFPAGETEDLPVLS